MKNVYLIVAFLMSFQFAIANKTNEGNIVKEPANRQVDDGGSITSLEDLLWLSENADAWDEDWVLEVDIDASETASWNNGLGFSPIGDSPTEFGVRQQIPYTGTFDGQGFVISNITINRTSEPYVGFFGQITGGTVQNLGLENLTVNGYRYVGGFVGYIHDGVMIDQCFATGVIDAYERGAGFVGQTYVDNVITNSYSEGTVTVNKWGGGFVGDNYTYSEISSCYSTSDVSGNDYIGGFASLNRWYSTINSCYATGNVSGTYDYTGGFVGINDDGYIENSFASGSVQGSLFVGGFAGQSEMIENTITGLYYCYSFGQVTGSSMVGALIGRSYAYVTDCYFDTETSGMSVGIGNSDSGQSATGLLSSEFAEESNFLNWNFIDIWSIFVDNTISPVARPYLGDPIITYSLSLVSNPEEAGLLIGSGSFIEGEEVDISAEVIGYYEFDNWTDADGNIISTDAETSIIMPAGDVSFTANFHSTVGIEDMDSKHFRFYPNPVIDQIQIETSESGILSIYDMKGRLIIERNIDKELLLDVSYLISGTYLISLYSLNTNNQSFFIKK